MRVNKNLYKKFNPNENFDHIIIGSGIGGLTAAITILKFKVILLFLSMNKLK